MSVSPQEKWQTIKALGIKGLNTIDDSSDIEDQELAEVVNMTVRDGFLAPRRGVTTLYDPPTGETEPLQLMTAKTSDGLEYLIGVYANHFYVYHETNSQWVRINTTYVPTETDVFYGWVNWLNGRGDDRFYFCNGVDNFGRWDIAITTVSGAYGAADVDITVADGSRFPASGSVVIKVGSTHYTKTFTRVNNVITINTALGVAMSGGESIAMEVAEKSGMEVGKVVAKYQQRLLVANYYGGETVMFYSVLNDPEDFSVAATIAGGGTQTIADGNGEITGIHNFGAFVIIEKEDSLHAFSFQLSDDIASKLVKIDPVAAGQSIGPLGMGSTSQMLNSLFFPTRSNGFVAITPASTGGQVKVETTILSKKINNYVANETELSTARVAANDNRIVWAVAADGGTVNTILIEYDLIRQAWLKHSAVSVQDFTVKANKILYLDHGTGEVNELFASTFADNDNPIPCQGYPKRLDFGEAARPKSEACVYVQGYMTPATEFYIDILFNEGGSLETQTYRIAQDVEGVQFSDPITDAMGNFILGNPILGSVGLSQIGDLQVFRCYLAIKAENQFYTVQPRVYSNKAAFYGVSTLGFDPHLEALVPQDMLVSPVVVE